MKKWWPVFLLPTFAAFVIGFIIPFVQGVYLSFCKFQTINKTTFIGVSNFLPVTEKGGKVCLELGGEPVLFDAPPQGYVSGKKNVMGVRPMDIVFDAKSPIRATIQRDTFLGNQYDYQVELLGKELRVERNALDVLADPTHYEAGQEVGLKFLNVKFYEEGAKA